MRSAYTMPIFTFTLLFKVDDTRKDDCIERLGASGCTDALPLSGLPGSLALNFCREAESMKDARASAAADVLKAVPGAELYIWTDDGKQIAVGGPGESDYDF